MQHRLSAITDPKAMKSNQHRVMLFLVGLVIISNCLTSTAAPWEKKDGMRLIAPERMARLLRKITKHKSEEGWLWRK